MKLSYALTFAGCYTEVKTFGSFSQRKILDNNITNKEKTVRFTRNDSWSIWGENQSLNSNGDQTLTQETPCR